MPGLGLGHGMGMGVGRSVSLFNRVHQELFGSGEQGIYMPSVHESFLRGDLFQDAAGTTPVTAAGQPVGLWLDRSGNGNHASQPTAAARPTLQQDANGMYVLRLDGVDDSLNVPGLDPLIEGVKPYEFVAAFNPDVDGQPAHSTSVLQKKHTVSPVSQTELTYIPSVDRGGINRFVAGTNVSINTADVVTKGVPTVFRWRYTGSRSEVGLNDSALAQGPEDTRDIGTSTAVSTAIGLSKVKGQIYGLVFIDRLLTGDEYTRLVLPLLRKSMGV